MRLRFAALALSLLLTGCATHAPTVPAGYSGPVAFIRDTGRMESATKGQMFFVAAIDGRAVYSSVTSSRKHNEGRGMGVGMSLLNHTIPAATVRIQIIGSHVTGAPIHAIVSSIAGTSHQVRKEVMFTPAPDGEYRVVGKLLPQGSDVWIEDAKTSERVTQ
jgi:hypothetical protein